jgi:hypothetical protein
MVPSGGFGQRRQPTHQLLELLGEVGASHRAIVEFDMRTALVTLSAWLAIAPRTPSIMSDNWPPSRSEPALPVSNALPSEQFSIVISKL